MKHHQLFSQKGNTFIFCFAKGDVNQTAIASFATNCEKAYLESFKLATKTFKLIYVLILFRPV